MAWIVDLINCLPETFKFWNVVGKGCLIGGIASKRFTYFVGGFNQIFNV